MTTAAASARDSTFRYLTIVGSVFAVGLLASYALGLQSGLPLPLDRNGVPLGRDFLNTWFYGRAFFDADPGRFYDRALYMRTVEAVFPQDAADRLWSYPPVFLMVAAPFGLMPYVAALAAWSVAGLAALATAVRRRGSLWLLAAVLTSPVVIYSLIAGQVSLFVASLLMIVFAQLDRRPVLAGLVLSLLVIKPQTIVLMPVFLIASRRWRVLLAAAGGAIAIVALSIAVNGLGAWTRFVELGIPTQVAEMKSTVAVLAPLSVSVTTAAVRAGLSANAVSCLQTSAGLLAVVLVGWVGWRRKRPDETTDYEGLVVLACSIFATPYFLIHDLAAFSTAVLVVSYRTGLVRNRFALLAILYAPLMQGGLSPLHLDVMPVLAIGFAVWLVVAREAPSRQATIPWAQPIAG